MRTHINRLLVLIVAGIITYYSIQPLPSTYGPELFNTALLYHAIAYFALAGALLLHFHDTTKGHIEAVLAAALFGATLELVQYGLSTRYFSLTDIAVNTFGASLVLLDYRISMTHHIIATEDAILARLFK